MRPQLLKQVIRSTFPIQRTMCIEGSPGGGKTTIVEEVAAELDVPIIICHLPTSLVEDFGIPYPSADADSFEYKMPKWFPVKGKAPDKGILLFDDRNQASSDLQKVIANICQARTLHGVPLPEGWMVISTGNRQSDRAGSNRVLSHLRNRETVVEFETHLDDWTEWAFAHNVKPEVIAFIRFRPDLLHSFDPNKDQNPTPRSWVEGVSDVLGLVPKETEYDVFMGAVGEGAAAEFMGFVKIYRELPDPASIFLNPQHAEVPENPATLYALSGALATHVTEANFDSLTQYLERVPPEFSVLTVTCAIKKKRELTKCMGFTQWAMKHKEVLF